MPKLVSSGVALHRLDVFNCLFAFPEIISKIGYPSLINRVIADVCVPHWKIDMQTYITASSNVSDFHGRVDANQVNMDLEPYS